VRGVARRGAEVAQPQAARVQRATVPLNAAAPLLSQIWRSPAGASVHVHPGGGRFVRAGTCVGMGSGFASPRVRREGEASG
jgi:hypothetical protein